MWSRSTDRLARGAIPGNDASIRNRRLLVESLLNIPTVVTIVGAGAKREWTFVQ